MALTKKALFQFISRRNTSEFQTNLQFMIDANACGFSVDDLGKAIGSGTDGYTWPTKYGDLREVHGKLALYNRATGKKLWGVSWIEPMPRPSAADIKATYEQAMGRS